MSDLCVGTEELGDDPEAGREKAKGVRYAGELQEEKEARLI